MNYYINLLFVFVLSFLFIFIKYYNNLVHLFDYVDKKIFLNSEELDKFNIFQNLFFHWNNIFDVRYNINSLHQEFNDNQNYYIKINDNNDNDNANMVSKNYNKLNKNDNYQNESDNGKQQNYNLDNKELNITNNCKEQSFDDHHEKSNINNYSQESNFDEHDQEVNIDNNNKEQSLDDDEDIEQQNKILSQIVTNSDSHLEVEHFIDKLSNIEINEIINETNNITPHNLIVKQSSINNEILDSNYHYNNYLSGDDFYTDQNKILFNKNNSCNYIESFSEFTPFSHNYSNNFSNCIQTFQDFNHLANIDKNYQENNSYRIQINDKIENDKQSEIIINEEEKKNDDNQNIIDKDESNNIDDFVLV